MKKLYILYILPVIIGLFYILILKNYFPLTTMEKQKKFCVVYSPKYLVDIGPHVFPTQKYSLIKNRLIEQRLITDKDIIEPLPATREQLLLVHTSQYLDDLLNLRWTHRTSRSELPLTAEIVEAYVLCAGGSIKATQFACLSRGCGIHLGGGFHHAFPDHAEGFCYINDIAVATR
ncbi:MAG: hypothetical protein N2246_10380, partial [Candidatus Sumerlaeia bacterium]|nr:hypothetical protein [Candidatus Sumerlaeia bacterium]